MRQLMDIALIMVCLTTCSMALDQREGSPLDELPSYIRKINDWGQRADFSHDGKRVLFIEKTYGDAFELDLASGNVTPVTHYDIWKLSLDGKEHWQRITHFTDYKGYKSSNPVVSDDGRFIAFQMAKLGDPAGVGRGLFLLNIEDRAKSIPVISSVLYQDSFDGSLSNWVVEQMHGGTVYVAGGKLEINDAKGCTVWFREKLEGPLMIEYEAVIIKQDGPHDRGSDLNCFWMAQDPQAHNDLFANSEARGGRFRNYHPLRLYYVGYGANHNSTTRFRRYTGTGERPVLPEHDLSDAKYMLTYNVPIKIQLIADGHRIAYLRNGEVIYDVHDPDPYADGWFGFRTVNNHMTIDNFKVYRLKTSR